MRHGNAEAVLTCTVLGASSELLPASLEKECPLLPPKAQSSERIASSETNSHGHFAAKFSQTNHLGHTLH